MAIPGGITDLLSELGIPAGAVTLAYGLVRFTKMLEDDASESALSYVSGLLKSGDITSLGKIVAMMVPVLFDRVFGERVFTFRFISRSILLTSIFWLILLAAKHPDWDRPLSDLIAFPEVWAFWYFLDWLSLLKARLIIKRIAVKPKISSTIRLFLLDIILSYSFPAPIIILVGYVGAIVGGIVAAAVTGAKMPAGNDLLIHISIQYLTLQPVIAYFSEPVSLYSVAVLSTLLTSVWTFLFVVSSVLAMMLLPIERLRRFTAWWFRDIETHPMTAIAKVAGTLIIIGALVIKGFRSIAQ